MNPILELLHEAKAAETAEREKRRQAKLAARGLAAKRAASGTSSFADNFLYAPTAEEMVQITWTKLALVHVTLEQECDCGARHKASQGLFVREKHPNLHLTRMRRTGFDNEDWLTLPLSQDTVHEHVSACQECFAAVQLIREALIDPRAGQLELSFGDKA